MSDAPREAPEAPEAPASSDPRRLLGQVISGRYRIDELIGEGGMGAVYRAEHTHMRKRLAVKVLHPAMVGIAEAVERFEREAIAGAHIEHPNVAAATDFGKLEDGSHFLVLELLEGEDLRSVIARGPVPPDRALRVARQVALALRATHQLGIVHRDIKPENVMLLQKEREADVVKVLDFGIAKVPVNSLAVGGAAAKALTKLGMVYGTPEYMAPEQALGEEIDGRADLYALGVVLYEMLTGRRPFVATSRSELVSQVMTKPPPPFAERAPGVSIPPILETITRRLLEKPVAARYQDADELLSDIDHAALELGFVVVLRSASSPDRSGAHRPVVLTADAPASEPPTKRAAGTDESTTVAPPAPKRAPAAQAAPASAKSGVPMAARLTLFGMILVSGTIALALTLRGSDAIPALEAEGSESPATSGAGASGSPQSGEAPARSASTAALTPPSRRGASAPLEELEAARSKGLPALGALAQAYPADPAVLKALMLAHAADKSGYAAAVAVAKRMFEADPATANDPDVKQILFMAANASPEVAVASIDVMALSMGTRGPDLLFELIVAPSVGKFPRERASTLLSTPEVQKRATSALLIANDLRASSPCKRKPLLVRAHDEGDARSLSFLTPLVATTGCGLILRNRDCYECLGSRAELRTAIAAIEKRGEKH